MATNSPELAKAIMTRCAIEHLPVAVLHGSKALRLGRVKSDVDVVSAMPQRETVDKMMSVARLEGLRVIQVWPYDLGCASLFVVSKDGTHGAQIDITSGARGHDAYGVIAPAYVEQLHVDHIGLPVVSELASYLYELRKAAVKGDVARWMTVAHSSRAYSDQDVELLARRVFSQVAAEAVIESLRRWCPVAGRSTRSRVRQLLRCFERVAHPVGAWVGVSPDEPYVASLASALASRLGQVVPQAVWCPATPDAVRKPGEFSTTILLPKLRPGVTLTPVPDYKSRLLDGVIDVDHGDTEASFGERVVDLLSTLCQARWAIS